MPFPDLSTLSEYAQREAVEKWAKTHLPDNFDPTNSSTEPSHFFYNALLKEHFGENTSAEEQARTVSGLHKHLTEHAELQETYKVLFDNLKVIENIYGGGQYAGFGNLSHYLNGKQVELEQTATAEQLAENGKKLFERAINAVANTDAATVGKFKQLLDGSTRNAAFNTLYVNSKLAEQQSKVSLQEGKTDTDILSFTIDGHQHTYQKDGSILFNKKLVGTLDPAQAVTILEDLTTKQPQERAAKLDSARQDVALSKGAPLFASAIKAIAEKFPDSLLFKPEHEPATRELEAINDAIKGTGISSFSIENGIITFSAYSQTLHYNREKKSLSCGEYEHPIDAQTLFNATAENKKILHEQEIAAKLLARANEAIDPATKEEMQLLAESIQESANEREATALPNQLRNMSIARRVPGQSLEHSRRSTVSGGHETTLGSGSDSDEASPKIKTPTQAELTEAVRRSIVNVDMLTDSIALLPATAQAGAEMQLAAAKEAQQKTLNTAKQLFGNDIATEILKNATELAAPAIATRRATTPAAPTLPLAEVTAAEGPSTSRETGGKRQSWVNNLASKAADVFTPRRGSVTFVTSTESSTPRGITPAAIAEQKQASEAQKGNGGRGGVS